MAPKPAHELYPVERVAPPERVEGDQEVRCQVAVVGTGAGGAVAAAELAGRGFDVLMLEEGLYYTAEDYAGSTPMGAIKKLYRDRGFTFTLGSPPILLPLGKCVGGTTVINSGTALRIPEETFAFWCREHGLSGLSWPELVSLYERVEPPAGVARIPESLLGANTALFRDGSRALGYEGEVLTRNASGCKASGRCFLGCPENAKQATNVSYVPLALARGARLRTGTKVDRVLFDGRRATGLEATVDAASPGGRTRKLTVRADRIVVAAGAIFSPMLLAASGLGRGDRNFGANLRIHPASRIVGMFDREIRGQYDVPQSYHLTQFLKEGMSLEGIYVPPAVLAPALPGFGRGHVARMRDYASMGIMGYRIIDETKGRVGRSVLGMPWIRYDIGEADTRKLVRCMAIAAEIFFAAGAKRVYVPVFGREELASSDQARALAAAAIPPTDIEISAYHPHGTLRIGRDARTGVTDIEGRVFGTEGLYVADASLFPESPIVNPMMTIMALASHVAERLEA